MLHHPSLDPARKPSCHEEANGDLSQIKERGGVRIEIYNFHDKLNTFQVEAGAIHV